MLLRFPRPAHLLSTLLTALALSGAAMFASACGGGGSGTGGGGGGGGGTTTDTGD